MDEIGRDKPIAERNFDAFLSHAHADKRDVVDALYAWCCDQAGLKVWYDSSQLHAGNISPQLGEGIADSQSGVIVLSRASIERNFVQKEASLFEMQQNSFRDFRIIILQIEDCPVPAYLQSLYRIDISRTGLTPEAAVKFLGALHKHHSSPETLRRPPVYMARGSRPSEIEKSQALAKVMTSAGFRILRDFPQPEMDLGRLRRIIRGCVGMVALVPHRPAEAHVTSDGILDEIRIAQDEKIPLWLVVDRGLDPAMLPLGLDQHPPVVRMLDTDIEDRGKLTAYAEHFRSELRRRGGRKTAHCFFGHVFRGKQGRNIYEHARTCVESIAGIPCYSGDELYGSMMLPEIVRRIADAEFCIFDISDEDGSTALSTCVEAGIAMGAAQAKIAEGDQGQVFRDVHIVSRGPRRDPPFMFRHMQVSFYETDLELIGLLRKICLRYRRIVE